MEMNLDKDHNLCAWSGHYTPFYIQQKSASLSFSLDTPRCRVVQRSYLSADPKSFFGQLAF